MGQLPSWRRAADRRDAPLVEVDSLRRETQCLVQSDDSAACSRVVGAAEKPAWTGWPSPVLR
jgi:hypothetical protein